MRLSTDADIAFVDFSAPSDGPGYDLEMPGYARRLPKGVKDERTPIWHKIR